MDPLSTSRRTLAWMCIYPEEKYATFQTKTLHILWTAVIFFTMGSSIIAVIALGVKEVLFSAMNVPAVIALIYTILTAYRLRPEIVHFLESLADICNKCKILFQAIRQLTIINNYCFENFDG